MTISDKEKPVFTKAIVKKPARSMLRGLTCANLGVPDYQRALDQHAVYVEVLKECGLEIFELREDEQYPDSTFVEDAALLTRDCAIITNPGAPSRRGETTAIRQILEDHFANIEQIWEPGTVDAGDIMQVGSHYYVGLSRRTNIHGANQVIEYLEKYGCSGSLIRMGKLLHLKTGVAYLEHNYLLACDELLTNEAFATFKLLKVDKEEAYAANSLWVNEKVLVPAGFPGTQKTIERAGYLTIAVELSEFQKLDGGLSCLSLRF